MLLGRESLAKLPKKALILNVCACEGFSYYGGMGVSARESTDSLNIWSYNHQYPCLISPAVDNYRLVTSPPLNLRHLCYHICDTAEVGAVAIMTPIGHVQLYNLISFPCLY